MEVVIASNAAIKGLVSYESVTSLASDFLVFIQSQGKQEMAVVEILVTHFFLSILSCFYHIPVHVHCSHIRCSFCKRRHISSITCHNFFFFHISGQGLGSISKSSQEINSLMGGEGGCLGYASSGSLDHDHHTP